MQIPRKRSPRVPEESFNFFNLPAEFDDDTRFS